MKAKYMNFIKKVIVCLVILLVVVCFSLSSSFSSFIYESNNHRAVEMITNKLSYSIRINNMETNKVTIKPGNNVINMELKSLNKVDTYYKLLYQNDDNLIIYDLNNNINGKIESEKTINVKLLIINNSKNSINCNFEVSGGYITRTLEEVMIANNYNEIDKSLIIGDYIEYNPNNSYEIDGKYFGKEESIVLNTIPTRWLIYDINKNGDIFIVSETSIELPNNLKIKGAYGYNNVVNLLNDISKNLYKSEHSLEVRNINLEDIESKLNKTLVTYGENLEYFRSLTNVNYPTLWEYEKNSIINNENTNGFVNRSEEYYVSEENSKQTKQVVIRDLKVNKDNIDIGNYLLSTRYVKPLDKDINWGIYSIKDGQLYLNPLYDLSSNEYEIPFSIRPIVKLSTDYLLN